MEPDERRKLERILEIVEKDHSRIDKLYRGMQWRRIFTVVYWILIIGIAVGAFYFIQPYIDQLGDFYDTFKGTLEGAQGFFGGEEGIEEAQQG
ncbi:MAG: hypothetical protein WD049_08675 [Candidatus Paceibacterota bacterium]